MSLRLVLAGAPAIAALALVLGAPGCSAGVQASDTTDLTASKSPNDLDEPELRIPPAGTQPSEFERRWSYLAAHSAPDRTTQWNGDLDGPVTLWHPNGTKRGEGSYRASRRDGRWVFWHENGQLRWQGTYVNGELEGRELAWHENGQLELEANWKGGLRDGVFAQWHENGRLAAQGEYRGGKRAGRFHYFDADGNADALATGHYVDDVRVAE